MDLFKILMLRLFCSECRLTVSCSEAAWDWGLPAAVRKRSLSGTSEVWGSSDSLRPVWYVTRDPSVQGRGVHAQHGCCETLGIWAIGFTAIFSVSTLYCFLWLLPYRESNQQRLAKMTGGQRLGAASDSTDPGLG